jgi:hypothetical protein
MSLLSAGRFRTLFAARLLIITAFSLAGVRAAGGPPATRDQKEPDIRIGWASRDVSTDKPVGIRGQFYLRVSEGVLDPVTVTALALSNDSDSVIFLSCDTAVIWSSAVKAVRDKIRALNPDIPADKIIMNATHTHASGDIFPLDDQYEGVKRMSGKDYLEFFSGMAAEAVAEAWEKRKPGSVAWGYGFADAARNRRTVYFDDTSKRPGAKENPGLIVNGRAVMYGSANDPMFSHFEAGADSGLNVLFTFDTDKKLTGALVNIPCPSQLSAHIRKLSADFWHETRIELRKRLGGDIYILPQCGAAGDLSPKELCLGKALERRLKLKGVSARQDIAERIASGVAEIFEWAPKDARSSVRLSHIVRTIELSRRMITDEEYQAELKNLEALRLCKPSEDPDPQKRLAADSTLGSRRGRCQEIIDRYNRQKTNPKLPMELHVVRLGDIAFASNRFELFSDYGQRIQARSPAVQTFIIQLAGSGVGERGGSYLPTARAEEGKGYSAEQYSNLAGSQGGQELVEETLKSLNELWHPAKN